MTKAVVLAFFTLITVPIFANETVKTTATPTDSTKPISAAEPPSAPSISLQKKSDTKTIQIVTHEDECFVEHFIDWEPCGPLNIGPEVKAQWARFLKKQPCGTGFWSVLEDFYPKYKDSLQRFSDKYLECDRQPIEDKTWVDRLRAKFPLKQRRALEKDFTNALMSQWLNLRNTCIEIEARELVHLAGQLQPLQEKYIQLLEKYQKTLKKEKQPQLQPLMDLLSLSANAKTKIDSLIYNSTNLRYLSLGKEASSAMVEFITQEPVFQKPYWPFEAIDAYKKTLGSLKSTEKTSAKKTSPQKSPAPAHSSKGPVPKHESSKTDKPPTN